MIATQLPAFAGEGFKKTFCRDGLDGLDGLKGKIAAED
jgi:hypothetical protein